MDCKFYNLDGYLIERIVIGCRVIDLFIIYIFLLIMIMVFFLMWVEDD